MINVQAKNSVKDCNVFNKSNFIQSCKCCALLLLFKRTIGAEYSGHKKKKPEECELTLATMKAEDALGHQYTHILLLNPYVSGTSCRTASLSVTHFTSVRVQLVVTGPDDYANLFGICRFDLFCH